MWYDVDKISIHAPREGSDKRCPFPWRHPLPISIHAPREGSDPAPGLVALDQAEISIHAPREGSDSTLDDVIVTGV